MSSITISFLAIVLYVTHSSANFTVTIEADHGYSTTAERLYSSGANNDQAVLLKQGGQINLFFQANGNEKCLMQVSDILYSDDGLTNVFVLHFNNYSIGQALTNGSTNNLLLNRFISTGQVGETAMIREGLNNLTITADTADEYGVEIDYVSLDIMNCSNDTVLIAIISNGSISYKCSNCTHCNTCNDFVSSLILAITVIVTVIFALIIFWTIIAATKVSTVIEKQHRNHITRGRT